MITTLRYRLKGVTGWVSIDRDVEALLPSEGAGIAHLFSVGSTSSLILIENDPNLMDDLFEMLEKLAPSDATYKHHFTWGDDNGFSHLRATLLGQHLAIPYENGKLLKGTWQNIVLINHDTRERVREVRVAFLKI